jgi:flagellar biosynthesis/type III secretory pathway chaperone
MKHNQETWDDLLILLGEMRVVFQEFMGLLGDEERMLLEMNRQGVARVTEKKEQVLDVMCRYEQQVTARLHQLAGFEDQKGVGLWLKEAAHPQVSSVNSILQDLFGLTATLQEQAKRNEALTRRTQHVVREAIHLIYSGLGNGPVYQGSGVLSFPSVPNSVHLHG